MNIVDQAFGLSPDVLAIRSRRSQLIAGNLANADTPHYKAVDIDFQQVLSQATGGSSLGGISPHRTDPVHFGSGATDIAADLRYRIPIQPAADGNTVETDFEHMEFMDNAIRYQASLNFLNGKIKSLLTALRGE